MRPAGSRLRRRRVLLRQALLGLSLVSCRVWYDTLPEQLGVNGMSGFSGNAGKGASAAGGTAAQAGQGAGATAAGAALGGASPTAGASAAGEATQAGHGGEDSGQAGAPGSGTCTTTAACTCDVFADHDYWFCKDALNFAGSEAVCESRGMTLVRVDTQAENDFLLSAGTAHGVFATGFAQIGASAQVVTSEWRWRDGALFWQGAANGLAVDGLYANWALASPTGNGNKACAGILDDGTWQDRSCTADVPAICEGP